jgi:O-methyltransferase
MATEQTSNTVTRPITAAGPGPRTEALRAAYLDLLKLCLCDLVGACTSEVTWTGDKRWFNRQLTGDDQLAGRAEGKDWTLNGLSMVGLRRLDDLQACAESVVRDEIEGDLIEAGVWRGGASILIRATVDSLGATDRIVWLADSFEGFPPPEQSGVAADRALETQLSGIDYFAPGLGAVKSYFARFGFSDRVKFVPGFFEETLGQLGGRRWSLIRIDADTYSATKLALEALYPGVAVAGYVVLDDYFHPWLPECKKAIDDFRIEHHISEPIHKIDWNSGRWRRESEPKQLGACGSHKLESIVAARTATVNPPTRIPTDRELQLTDELKGAQARLRALEGALDRLTSSPFAGSQAWIRRVRRARSDRRGPAPRSSRGGSALR